jgi:hypothetical protein
VFSSFRQPTWPNNRLVEPLTLAIDGDAMSWTALREGDDGKTYTSNFEMKKVA